ncbi:MarR family winged helix-turn-helix transcriptional regulator [Humidisolicoccus flavus]|uniref:MarR family winged helix-turn-helix transcriptional regulator n=1 Tax=Humidisolicoccus flavus TaxID=3111414 RepID=UPI00324A0F60
MPRSLSLSDELRVAVARLSRRIRQSRADTTLSFPHYSALGSMRMIGVCTLSELAEQEQVTAPSMNRTVNSLVEHGYVARTPHASDGRKLMLEITESGDLMIEQTKRQRNLWLAEQLDALTPAERSTLSAAIPLLQRLAE